MEGGDEMDGAELVLVTRAKEGHQSGPRSVRRRGVSAGLSARRDVCFASEWRKRARYCRLEELESQQQMFLSLKGRR